MASDISLERFLLPSEAARILGCSAARVRGLVDSGELPAERTDQGYRLIPFKAVERLAKERERARSGR